MSATTVVLLALAGAGAIIDLAVVVVEEGEVMAVEVVAMVDLLDATVLLTKAMAGKMLFIVSLIEKIMEAMFSVDKKRLLMPRFIPECLLMEKLVEATLLLQVLTVGMVLMDMTLFRHLVLLVGYKALPPTYGASRPNPYGGDLPIHRGASSNYDGGLAAPQVAGHDVGGLVQAFHGGGAYRGAPIESPSKIKQCDEACGDSCDNSRIYISVFSLYVTIEELMDLFGRIGQGGYFRCSYHGASGAGLGGLHQPDL